MHSEPSSGLAITELRIDRANSFLVFDPDYRKHAVLIDTGMPKNAKKLDEMIREAGIDPADLDAAIITHGHYEHGGGASYFQQTYGTTLIAGSEDKILLENDVELPVCPTSPVARLISARKGDIGDWTSKPDVYVSERMDLAAVSSIPGELIVLPGHTSGSLIVNIGKATFVGDIIRGKLIGSGPALHFFMCDIEENTAGLDRLLTTLSPSAEDIFPGHMDNFSADALRRYVDQRHGD